MPPTTFRSLYTQTCQDLIALRKEITAGNVGAFLQTCSPPNLPEASSTEINPWPDQSIEPPEEVTSEGDPIARRLLNAVRNLKHLFDSAWEAGFKNEAQACFYRLTRDLLQAVEHDGYIPGRGAEDDDEEDGDDESGEEESSEAG